MKRITIYLLLLSLSATAQQGKSIKKKQAGGSSTVKSDYQRSRDAVEAFVMQLNENVLAGMKVDENLKWENEKYLDRNKKYFLRINCRSKDATIVTFGILPAELKKGSHFEISLYRNLGDVFERHIDFIVKGTVYSYPIEIKKGKFVLQPEMNGGKGHDYNEIISGGMGN